MTITATQTTRIDDVTIVTLTSDLSGRVYYHWYLDGVWLGMTTAPTRTIHVPVGEQARLEAIDTNDADFDPIAGAPDAWPARRTLWWVRSLDDDCDHYRIEQQQDGGPWTTLGLVPHRAQTWDYRFLTGRLDDLSLYGWRIVPVDRAGNDGSPLTLAEETVVRTPDAPNFSISFDPETTRVTFAAA